MKGKSMKTITTKPPLAVRKRIAALGVSAEHYRKRILDELAFYAKLEHKRPDQDEYYWIAFKLGFDHPRESVPVVRWAKGEA